MITENKTENVAARERISILWIVVMVNMAFADICSFMLPWSLGDNPLKLLRKSCWYLRSC